MKKIILIGLLLYTTISFAEIPSINLIRNLYQKAPAEEKSCKKLIELLLPYNENNNALLLGYKASGTMMMAKHAFNPLSKLSYFKKGKHMLEIAIAADSKNIELRFLRFAVQTEIPSFLGYHDSIEIDKNFLLQSLPGLNDIVLKGMIISCFKNADYLRNGARQK